LKEKAELVKWNQGRRQEYYAVFAKSFKEKKANKTLFLFDLDDLNQLL